MALREILTEPNKLLREKSLTVEGVDEDLQKLMDDMIETMYAAPGIGLAAIQVGVPKRVIVLDIGGRDKPESTNDRSRAEYMLQACLQPQVLWTAHNNLNILYDTYQVYQFQQIDQGPTNNPLHMLNYLWIL